MAAKQNVKRRIVDAAWELFYEKGYDDTTVDDIIRLSETSKGSFYYYFSSKDSLLIHCQLFWMRIMQSLKMNWIRK